MFYLIIYGNYLTGKFKCTPILLRSTANSNKLSNDSNFANLANSYCCGGIKRTLDVELIRFFGFAH